EGVVRNHRGESRSDDARRADQDLGDRRGEIVVGHTRDHSCEVLERGDVRGEKPGRVLLGADHVLPREELACLIAKDPASSATLHMTPLLKARDDCPCSRAIVSRSVWVPGSLEALSGPMTA